MRCCPPDAARPERRELFRSGFDRSEASLFPLLLEGLARMIDLLLRVRFVDTATVAPVRILAGCDLSIIIYKTYMLNNLPWRVEPRGGILKVAPSLKDDEVLSMSELKDCPILFSVSC